MVSLPYASGSGSADWKVLKMPCCMSGKYNDLGTEETKRRRMERCSGDVAMGLRPTKGPELQRRASMVVGIAGIY
jgi:hypothetical protein